VGSRRCNFERMKRIFTIIIVLITLSLLGIIYIQLNWINNMIRVREEDFEEKARQAVMNAGSRMAQKAAISRRQDISLDPLLLDFNARPQSILKQFTTTEIRGILYKAFADAKLNITRFEFSVSDKQSDAELFTPEMHSNGFLQMFNVKGVKKIAVLIMPESGSPLEGLGQDGSIMVLIPNVTTAVVKSMGWMIGGALLFTFIIISAFYLTVTTMLRQKKLSEIKSDFINNMTHELKTPLATISLAVDALKNEKVMDNREKMGYFTSIIKDENKRMNKQVETILQAALLDKEEVQLNMKPLRVHEVIERAIAHFKLVLEERNGTIDVSLKAKNDEIKADEVHFNNLVRNLMDNAIKYSKPDQPLHLRISTSSSRKHLSIYIEDNGIGMSRETLGRIFEKFYRAHTGNVHNVKGFGLGLTYVKAMVEAHGGRIKADSSLGKGSTFTVEMPLHGGGAAS
jgi:two-component system, OmpR family, phosphate regulon sensor histidine kinase PhoR